LERRQVLEVIGVVAGGRLKMSIAYSGEKYEEESIRELMQRYREGLEEIIKASGEGEGKVYTPSDFEGVKISQEELDEIAERVGEIEGIYPLSPMQQGMLYHSLLAP